MYPFFFFLIRPATTGQRALNTEAEMGIEFNNTSSEGTVPKADEVADTLVAAVTNSSNNFNLSVDSTTVKVVG